MLLRVILLTFLPATATGNTHALNGANRRSGSCNESFPLAHPDSQNHYRRYLFPWRRERRHVAIRPGDESGEFYETGEYYAPLCPDGRHIDIRKLYRCNGGSCLNEDISVRIYYLVVDGIISGSLLLINNINDALHIHP